MTPATYFLGRSVLGTYPSPTWNAIDPSHSLAYSCPKCGDIWARLFSPALPEWMFVTRPCEKCGRGDGFGVPGGSLLLTWNPHHLQELPQAALRREFLLHYQERFP